jgi:hypothetical protein
MNVNVNEAWIKRCASKVNGRYELRRALNGDRCCDALINHPFDQSITKQHAGALKHVMGQHYSATSEKDA